MYSRLGRPGIASNTLGAGLVEELALSGSD